MVSLAEVEVLHGADNVARRGAATQSSTAYGGQPELAIDGNTNGDYNAAHSTTHTEISDNPWWEVDLKIDTPIDRIVVWNRTDNELGVRLAGCEVIVLDSARKPIWQQSLPAAPAPSAELWVTAGREIELAQAMADHAQPTFPAAQVLGDTKTAPNGWGIGGGQGQSHTLGITTKAPVDVPPGWRLVATIEQNSASPNHTLGRLRLSATTDGRAIQQVVVAPAVLAALAVPADKRTEAQTAAINANFRAVTPALVELDNQIAALTKKIADLKPETVPIMRELPADKQRVTKIQRRGNFLDVGDTVTGGTPAVFPPLPAARR